MGIAMLSVMWGHSQLTTGIFIIDMIKRCGYGGVDMFLLLSGMGLFFSLNKNQNTKEFYKKRVLRILPYYFPIVLLFSLFLVWKLNMQPDIIFYNLTTLSFWLNYTGVYYLHGFDWYIPSLLFLYAVTPPYFILFKKKPEVCTILFSLLGIFISLLISDTRFCYLLPLTTRFPIYFIGIFCGHAIINKYKINKKWSVMFTVIMVIGFALLFISFQSFSSYIVTYGVVNYPFILITFPILLILSSIMNLFSRYKYPFLSFVGKYSLVIYLLHERVLVVLNNTFISIKGSIVINLVAIVCTFIVAYYYQNGIDNFIKKKSIGL